MSRSGKKRKRTPRWRRKKRRAPQVGRPAVRLEVTLEIAKGHDGFLRGAPEPVLVCGLFALVEQGAVLLGRGVGRFSRPKEFPTTVELSEPVLVEARRPGATQDRLAVVVLALEEDDGGDIQRAYALLEGDHELLFLETSDEPVAVTVAELLRHDDWTTPRKVDFLADGQRFDQTCSADKWVAAAAFASRIRRTHRVHLLSADQLNDWTAVLTVR